jgi:hypothetical protein
MWRMLKIVRCDGKDAITHGPLSMRHVIVLYHVISFLVVSYVRM